MAAGLGFKTFAVGEVLTAADTNGYLMQGVLVFASAAARDAAITSPQEGQFAYLKDTNVTTYYTGSAWANLDTTGMTNPMTTTGDMVYSSSGSTPARLGVGSTGQVLTVAGGVPTWATPAGGGKVLQVLSQQLNADFTTSSDTLQDTGLSVSITPATTSSRIMVFITGKHYYRGNNGGTFTGIVYKLLRGSTSLSNDTIDFDAYSQSGYAFGNGFVGGLVFIDSPATTSSTTYKYQIARNQVGNYVGLFAEAQLILMEIGA